MKKFAVVKDVDTLISNLTETWGIPKIDTNLSVYARNEKVIIEIRMINNQCYVRIYNDDDTKDDKLYKYFKSTEPLLIENRNIKYIFKTMHNLGVKEAIISRITMLEFCSDESKILIEKDTILGNLLSGTNDILDDALIKAHTVDIIQSADIENLIEKRNISKSPIFDALGNINSVIKHHADIYGINLSLNEQTIRSAAMYKSNDFTELEEDFRLSTAVGITDTAQMPYKQGIFKPMSVIIPSFNSSKSILKTLAAIESQFLVEKEKKLLEVIVIDDGSVERVADIVDKSSYTFDLRIVRFEQNLGLSNARNVGASLSRYEYLTFIDSDILLSENYIYEHNVRMQSLPDAILVSLKQNIHSGDTLCHFSTIEKGLSVPESYNDKRLFREQKKNTPWVNEISSNGLHEILSETNYLTSFGNGRIINGFDLPSAVVGHNMSMKKRVFVRIGGFHNQFVGWGLEDTLFGAKAIAQGCFIIPVLACGVYHIDHPVRQNSNDEKNKQYRDNIQQYKRIIEEHI